MDRSWIQSHTIPWGRWYICRHFVDFYGKHRYMHAMGVFRWPIGWSSLGPLRSVGQLQAMMAVRLSQAVVHHATTWREWYLDLFVSEVIQQPHVDIRTCFLNCSYVGVLRCISCMSWVAAKLLPEIVTGYVLSYDSGDYTDFLNNRRSTIEKGESKAQDKSKWMNISTPWKFTNLNMMVSKQNLLRKGTVFSGTYVKFRGCNIWFQKTDWYVLMMNTNITWERTYSSSTFSDTIDSLSSQTCFFTRAAGHVTRPLKQKIAECLSRTEV